MKKLAIVLAAPAFALAAFQAAAIDTGTYTDSFGTIHSVTDVPVTAAVSETISLPTFGQLIIDESIVAPSGQYIELQSIHLTLDASLSTDGLLTNNSIANARGTLQVLLTAAWQAAVGAPLGSNFQFAPAFTFVINDESAPAGTFDIPGGGGQWDPAQIDFDAAQQSYNDTGLTITGGAWFAPGTFDINYTLGASTLLTGQVQSGSGNFSQSFDTGTFGTASIYYDYDFQQTQVPAPAPLALMAFGLGALGLRRRFSK